MQYAPPPRPRHFDRALPVAQGGRVVSERPKPVTRGGVHGRRRLTAGREAGEDWKKSAFVVQRMFG